MNGYCNGRQIEGPRGVSRDACWQYCTVVEGDPYAEHNPNTDTYTDIGSGCWCHASCTGIIIYDDFTPRRSATVIMGPCGMTVPPPTTGATPATWPYSSQPCALGAGCRSDICTDVAMDCCASLEEWGEPQGCMLAGYSPQSGGISSYLECPSHAIYQCCVSTVPSPPSPPPSPYCVFANVG